MGSSLNGTGVAFSNSTSQATAYLGVRGQVFTSSGTFTIPSGITAIKVTVVGGGGGGGPYWNCAGYGAGAGAGGTAIKYLTGLTPGNTLTIVIGAGGVAGATDTNNSTSGGASSVSSGTQSITTISGTGGAKGYGYSSYTPGSGGVGSGGDLSISGESGYYQNANIPSAGGLSSMGTVGKGGGSSANGNSGVVVFEW